MKHQMSFTNLDIASCAQGLVEFRHQFAPLFINQARHDLSVLKVKKTCRDKFNQTYKVLLFYEQKLNCV